VKLPLINKKELKNRNFNQLFRMCCNYATYFIWNFCI